MSLSTTTDPAAPLVALRGVGKIFASGSTAIQRAVSRPAPATSCQVISNQSRFGNFIERPFVKFLC